MAVLGYNKGINNAGAEVRLMLYKQMKYFMTVVECNSFTEAAEVCYISQSAMSQQIKLLEYEIGVPLLKRENRKFYLTPAGEYFYRNCKNVLAETARLKAETLRIGKYGARSLKAGYLKTYCGSGIYCAVADFTRSYPDVKLELIPGSHEELYDGLRDGILDIILNDQRRAFSDEYVNFTLTAAPWYAEISETHVLAGQKTLELSALNDYACILVADAGQQEKERDFYAHTLGFADNFIFAESLEEARLLTVAGKGYLLADGYAVMPVPAIVRRPLLRGGTQIQRNYCAFWKKGNENKYIPLFAEQLKAALQKEIKIE